MGSDEASIEAITRHVQRANMIYRNTGEMNRGNSALADDEISLIKNSDHDDGRVWDGNVAEKKEKFH